MMRWQAGALLGLAHSLALYACSAAPASEVGNQLESGVTARPGLKVDYFDASDFTRWVATRTEGNIDHTWNFGSPVAGVGSDHFSARWTGNVTVPGTNDYTFYLRSNEGARLLIDDRLIVDDWRAHRARERSNVVALSAGAHRLKVEYYENTGSALVQLSWASSSFAKQIVPPSAFSLDDAVESPGGVDAGTDAADAPAAPPPQEAGAGSGFLTRQGSAFYLRGQPTRFAGINAYGLATCEGGDGYYGEADLNALFAALPPSTVTRVWATSRASLADLDRVVARAAANGQMLILSLADGANHCNKGDLQLSRSFYQTGYKADYFTWIATVVPRYANSPAVAMWEITNEPGWGCPGDCGVTRDEMRNFFDTAAARIKSLDPNHLVESGAMGKDIASMAAQGDFAYVHSGANVDVLSLHEYEYDYNGNERAQSWYPTAKAAAEAVGKPLIIGEVGATLSQPSNVACHDVSRTLDAIVDSKLTDYFSKGANGVFVWDWMKAKPSWVATGCSSGQHFFYGPTNSVFSVLKAHR